MTKEEHRNCLKRGFGRRFPVMLEEDDYDGIYSKLGKDRLVEFVQGKLRPTEKGRKELKILAEKPVAYIAWTQKAGSKSTGGWMWWRPDILRQRASSRSSVYS
jgi:hypothetical protein